MTAIRTLVPLAATIALAGCISFGAKPPPSLLTLTSSAQPPVGQQQVAAVVPGTSASTLSVGGRAVATVTSQPLAAPPPAPGTVPSITIQAPAVPQELATPRVPVQATPTTIAYLKNALWVEPPARAFQRVLGDTITVRTGRVVLSSAQSFQTGSVQLTGELRQFGIDAASRSAVVVYDASLLRSAGIGIAKQRFEARVPVATIDATGAGTGLNAAANQVAAEVADWVGR